jgi:hypothetical protein
MHVVSTPTGAEKRPQLILGLERHRERESEKRISPAASWAEWLLAERPEFRSLDGETSRGSRPNERELRTRAAQPRRAVAAPTRNVSTREMTMAGRWWQDCSSHPQIVHLGAFGYATAVWARSRWRPTAGRADPLPLLAWRLHWLSSRRRCCYPHPAGRGASPTPVLWCPRVAAAGLATIRLSASVRYCLSNPHRHGLGCRPLNTHTPLLSSPVGPNLARCAIARDKRVRMSTHNYA